jgi:hypothetical protein
VRNGGREGRREGDYRDKQDARWVMYALLFVITKCQIPSKDLSQTMLVPICIAY